MNNNDTAARRAIINAKIDAAYDPENCESCEIQGGTCWECAMDAFE
jgi:hypothetical protein